MKNRNPHNWRLTGHSTIRISLCAITFCAFSSMQSMAQSIWSGATNTSWSEPGNWTPASESAPPVVPVNNDTLTFGNGITTTGSSSAPLNNDLTGLILGNPSVNPATNAINFTHAGPAGISPNDVLTGFFLGGNAITLAGNIVTSSAPRPTGSSPAYDITDTIAMDVVLNGGRTIDTASTGGTSNARVSHNLIISGLISDASGGFGLTKAGNASLTLSNGGNTFSGALNINLGTVVVSAFAQSGAPSPIGSGSVVNFGSVNSTGILMYVGSTAATFGREINLASTGTGGGTIDNSATDPLHTLTVDGTFTNAGSGNKTFFLGGTNTGANVFESTLVDNGGNLSFTKLGTGTWTLTGANTHSGNISISAGTLSVATIADTGSSNLGIANMTTTNTIKMGQGGQAGTLIYTGTGATTARQVTIGGGTAAAGGGATIQATAADGTSTGLKFTAADFNTTGSMATVNRNLTLGGSNTDANEISGIIVNHGTAPGVTSVVKNGVGRWILSGANIYAGATSVTAGTLLVNGDSSGAAGAVTVSGGTLGGSGSLGGAVTVGAAGSLAPGNAGVGSLTLASNLTVSAMANGGAGKLNFELGAIGASDQIAVGGTLTIGADVLGFSDFNFTTLAGLSNGTYTLITGAAVLTGTLDAANLTGTLGAGPAQGTLQLSGNNLELVVTGVGGASDPYLTWAGAGVAFDADANNDGVENGLAWLLGAANPTVNATGLLPTATQSGGNLTLNFDMRPASARGTSQLFIEHSSDLGIGDAWTSVLVPDATGGAAPVTFAVSGTDPLDVVITISSSQAAGGKLFSRLRAVK